MTNIDVLTVYYYLPVLKYWACSQHVYKSHLREPTNVSFVNIYLLYTGSDYIHYSLNGENKTALYRQWFVIYRYPLRQVWSYIITKRKMNRILLNWKVKYMIWNFIFCFLSRKQNWWNYLQCSSHMFQSILIKKNDSGSVLDTTFRLCDKVCQWLATRQWFSPDTSGTSIFSTNKTNRHDITDLLLKVALNIITLNLPFFV